MPATAKQPKPEPLSLRERFEPFAEAPEIDPAAGVVKNVKVLGTRSRNGKVYSDAALGDACRLFEGTTVYVNHPASKTDNARSYQDRFGTLVGLTKQADGVYAKELRYNPHHQLAESFAWDCEHNPKGVGLSINGHTNRFERQKDGTILVKGIDDGYSVDLVDNPATVGGLFEQTGASAMDPNDPLNDPAATVTPDPGVADAAAGAATGDHKDDLVAAVFAIADELKAGALTQEDAKKRITALLGMIDSDPGDTSGGSGSDSGSGSSDASQSELPDEMSDEEASKATEQLRRIPSKLARWAARRLDGIRVRERFAHREKLARQKLPSLALTEQFMADLRDAPTDARAEAMIADRAKVVRSGPISAPAHGAGQPQKDIKAIAAEMLG